VISAQNGGLLRMRLLRKKTIGFALGVGMKILLVSQMMIEQPPFDVDIKLSEYLVRQLNVLSNQASFVPIDSSSGRFGVLRHFGGLSIIATVSGVLSIINRSGTIIDVAAAGGLLPVLNFSSVTINIPLS
jgi:hypothetical protein